MTKFSINERLNNQQNPNQNPINNGNCIIHTTTNHQQRENNINNSNSVDENNVVCVESPSLSSSSSVTVASTMAPVSSIINVNNNTSTSSSLSSTSTSSSSSSSMMANMKMIMMKNNQSSSTTSTLSSPMILPLLTTTSTTNTATDLTNNNRMSSIMYNNNNHYPHNHTIFHQGDSRNLSKNLSFHQPQQLSTFCPQSMMMMNETMSNMNNSLTNNNWRDEADGSEEDRMIRFISIPITQSKGPDSTTSNTAIVHHQNQQRLSIEMNTNNDNSVDDLNDNQNNDNNNENEHHQNIPFFSGNIVSSTMNSNDNIGHHQINMANINTNNNNQNRTKKILNRNAQNPQPQQQQIQQQEFYVNRIVDLMDSFKKLLKSSPTSNIQQPQQPEDHQRSTIFNNNNINNNRRTLNDSDILTREKVSFQSTNNNNHRPSPLQTSTNNDVKLNKTSNFNFYLPSTSTSNPSTSSSYRFNSLNNNNRQNIDETIINKNQQGQKQFNNCNNFRHGFRRFQSVPSNPLDEQFNLMNNFSQQIHSNPLETIDSFSNQDANFIVDTTSPFDNNYFKQINQQVYQLLMLQNYQINQQHQLIMAWIECQQEWLRLQQSSTNQSAAATVNESNNLVDQIDCPPSSPSIINHPLNNQTVPGVRANNFLDNFRSQSFQNKLQTSTNLSSSQQQSNNRYPLFANRENFHTPNDNVACNHLCQSVCNKNSRSHSIAGLNTDSNLIFGHSSSQNNDNNRCKNQLKNNLINTSPYLSPHHHYHRLHSQQNQRLNNSNVDNQHLRNRTNNADMNERKLSKLISMVEKLVNSNNDGSNLNELKRKKTSNIDPANLPNLREDACECDLDVGYADPNDDSDEDDDDETIQNRSNQDESTNFHHIYQQSSSSSSTDFIVGDNGQRKNEILKNNSKSTNSEIIRPLMPAEGRSATEPQPPPFKPLKLPIMLSTLSSSPSTSSSSQQKTSNRPPITGNDSSTDTFVINKKPNKMPSSMTNGENSNENSSKTVIDSSYKNHDKLSNGNLAVDEIDKSRSNLSVSNDHKSFLQKINLDRSKSLSSSLADSSKGKNESQKSDDKNDTGKPLHINDQNQRNGHDMSSSSDEEEDDDVDDGGNDQRNEEQQPQSPPQHQADIRIHVVPMVANGNANEVRTSVRLSGDGEQGL